jgi:hypothetical protein
MSTDNGELLDTTLACDHETTAPRPLCSLSSAGLLSSDTLFSSYLSAHNSPRRQNKLLCSRVCHILLW